MCKNFWKLQIRLILLEQPELLLVEMGQHHGVRQRDSALNQSEAHFSCLVSSSGQAFGRKNSESWLKILIILFSYEGFFFFFAGNLRVISSSLPSVTQFNCYTCVFLCVVLMLREIWVNVLLSGIFEGRASDKQLLTVNMYYKCTMLLKTTNLNLV